MEFKNIDIYGQKVQLTYKGNTNFTTNMGAVATLITVLALLSFTIRNLSN